MPEAWDTRPLTEPLTRDQVRAWRRDHREVRSGVANPLWGVFVVAPVLAVVVVMALTLFRARPALDGRMLLAALPVLAVLAIAGLALLGVLRGSFGRTERLMRLHTFAERNGFVFSPRDADPSYPGIVFQQGRRRTAIDHIVRREGRFLDIGDFRYTTGSGKNQKTRTWGFMALHLDRRLPNMLLDARANDGIVGSNLPIVFARDQVLSLEGDFDAHFTLYCPREYERDALYVFTPDLMALLIDEAGAFDIEVVDDWMFVYAPPIRNDPAVLLRMLRIADTVGAKAVRRTEYYADERTGDRAANLVAPQGARLRRGMPWATIAVVAVFVVGWFGIQFLLR